MKPRLLTLLTFLFFCINSFAQVPSHILKDGLVGYWGFNGNANDESGNTNDGTTTKVTLTNDRFGNANSAYQFNGIDSRIETSKAFFDVGWNNFTISCWINTSSKDNSGSPNNSQNIFNTDPHNGFAINIYGNTNPFDVKWNNKYLMFVGAKPDVRNWDVVYNAYSNVSPSISKWEHVLMMKKGDTYSLYVNGVLEKSFKGLKAVPSFFCKIIFGNLAKGVNQNESFLGKLDDYAIWNRTLSTTEITNLYQSPNSNLPIDLSLKSRSSNSIVQKDSSGTMSFTLKNKGTNKATNVKVLLKIPYSPPFVVKNTQNCSKGTFDSNMWVIPELAAGDSCTLNVTYQPTQSGVWYVEAEVFSADQEDIDSKVNNGIDTEDDFTRACMSIPIKVTTNIVGMQLMVEDTKVDINQWFKDGNIIIGATQNTLQVTSVGKYSYNTNTFICPTQGCCPFILEKAIEPVNCCTPLEYIMNRQN